jgi:hypothetical protein
MNCGLHAHRSAFKFELAEQQAAPQIQRLVDLLDVVGFRLRSIGAREIQTDAAKVQPMRIFAQPVEQWLLPAV